jgi:hypothetical protein
VASVELLYLEISPEMRDMLGQVGRKPGFVELFILSRRRRKVGLHL